MVLYSKMRSSLIIRGALAVLFICMCTFPELQAQVDEKRPVSDLTKEILNELTEEERSGLRAAVNEVWQAEEVETRRREMLEANLAYRKALQKEFEELQAVLSSGDAEVREMLQLLGV